MGSGGPVGGRAGSLLREFRRAAGLSQRQLAGAAGVSVGVVRDLEQGRTGRLAARSVAALAAALGLDASRAREFAFAARGKPGPAAAGGPARVRLAVLGPLAAWRDHAAVELGPPSQRAVLGLLALSPGELVRRETLIDAWWGEDPPPSAASQVQARVSRLRRILDPGRPARDRGGLLASAGTGYRLRVSAGQLDLLAFRDLAGRAGAARRVGQVAAACGLYESALGLWRGDPLADVGALQQHPAVTGLFQQRWAAIVSYAEAACELGWYDRVLPLVWPLAEREPLHETAHAVLMIALAGTGRQAAALEVFQTLRRRLDEQLGVRPGRELARAHLRVLRADLSPPCAAPATASLQGRRVPGRKATTAPAVPRQLPAASPHFVGRAAELAALSELLDEPRRAAGTVVISAIGGTAGVGKTTLAMHWAQRVVARFPDGQLYANLRGFGPSGRPATPAEALRGFLDALAVPPERIPRDLAGQAGLYRSVLAGRRVLIVLDNARDAAQVRPLLPGAPGCLVLVTSRRQLASLAAADGARLIDIGVLTEAEARDLLAARIGTGRVAAEPDAAGEIIAACGRLPLALAIAAARAAARPGFPLAALAAELRERRLDALAAGDDPAADVRAVFSWSYRALTPAAARLFRLLGLHPGPDISAAAAASLGGVAARPARAALATLADLHLVSEHVPGRFALHDLLRGYAAELARTIDPEPGQHAAARRMLDHYLHTAHGAALLLIPHPLHGPVALPPRHPGAGPEQLADAAAAHTWFDAERLVLLAVIEQAAATGWHAHAWQLAQALMAYHYRRRGRWHDLAAAQHTALAAARRAADRLGQARAHEGIGNAFIWLSRHDRARAHLRAAMVLYRQLGDTTGQATIHLGLGLVLSNQGRVADALGHAKQALDLYRAAGDQRGQASSLNNIGWSHALLGDYQQAVACCQQALALQRELCDHRREADTLDSLGYAYHHLSQHDHAITCYRQAMALHLEHGEPYSEATVLDHLGDAHRAAGDLAAARAAWHQALDILDDLDHPDAGQIRTKLTTHQTYADPPRT
jgi:DNA-binding SARP family transcriptional activator/tetratricopeptide (TPR) repeat protein